MQEDNIKYYVLDSSFILSFLLPDERSEEVMKVFSDYSEGKINFVSSSILPLEVVNGLRFAIGDRVNKATAVNLIYDFLEISVEYVTLNLEEVLNISLHNNVSVYDAAYLYLSKSQKVPLLTLDKVLQKLA